MKKKELEEYLKGCKSATDHIMFMFGLNPNSVINTIETAIANCELPVKNDPEYPFFKGYLDTQKEALASLIRGQSQHKDFKSLGAVFV